ncbi:MAG: hypothetical protein AAB446_00230 [Patescibacteria group bacterium]
MLASSVTGFNGASFAPYVTAEAMEAGETSPIENKKVSNDSIEKSMNIEKYVRNYFSDIPVMIEIAKCESHFRQKDKDGDVLRGEVNNLDRGVMQINEYYHNENSEKLGFDILTLEGNTAYARYLFDKYGVKPWQSSSKCWGRTVAYSEYKELAINR